MTDLSRIRVLLIEQFDGNNAHINFAKATNNLTLQQVGTRPKRLPHSIWELAEHIRIAQFDILNFSTNPQYESINWPDDYWPSCARPENNKQWKKTCRAFRDDHQAMTELIKDPENDLLTPLAHGDGQTLFREAMLIVDHNAYHIAQIVQVRRLLQIW